MCFGSRCQRCNLRSSLRHLPKPVDYHPLRCHRRRTYDRDCFDVIIVRLTTGCSWVDAEKLTGATVSDTTARSRKDEWKEAGVFDLLVIETLNAYDRIIGLDLTEVAVDGSLHKSPCGGNWQESNRSRKARMEVINCHRQVCHTNRIHDRWGKPQ